MNQEVSCYAMNFLINTITLQYSRCQTTGKFRKRQVAARKLLNAVQLPLKLARSDFKTARIIPANACLYTRSIPAIS